MDALQIARRMAELNRPKEAAQAYTLALHQGSLAPQEELEAAAWLLQSGENYQAAYTTFYSLYNRNLFRDDCLSIMTGAFYDPNVKPQKNRYEKNCAALRKYPYLFRRDFPAFEDLPIRFYPYGDRGYLPFSPAEERFDPYVDFNHPVISRNFFQNLDNPILAKDVYSQYELEYLYDNVRPSEDIGRENHIYLHYESWETFCAHLQVLNIRQLLDKKKIIFLFGEELSRYPIDFQAEYGVDYSQYPVKPIGVQDVHRLIWHTQLSSDNGGDFFNEVFDNHPNLICLPSVMMDNLEESIREVRGSYEKADKARTSGQTPSFDVPLVHQCYWSGACSDKDIFIMLFMLQGGYMGGLDHAARIAPALFFQPHFAHIDFDMTHGERDRTVLLCKEYDKIRSSPVFKAFKYIKTFSPLRRFTTSAAATLRWQIEKRNLLNTGSEERGVATDLALDRSLNRSFMIDPEDRLYQDSILVRFEDGKTNPEATFRALAAFLDLPYTESMTYCSSQGVHDVETAEGNVVGFDTATVYRTYDDYATDDERAFIEFCLRDAYQFYGYDFHYYDGGPVDEERIEKWVEGFTKINEYIALSWKNNVLSDTTVSPDGNKRKLNEEEQEEVLAKIKEKHDKIRLKLAKRLMGSLYFVNKNGQPLRMMPLLKPDPALLKEPLYH